MRAFATAEHTHAHTNRQREREREARARRHACGGTWRSLKFFSGSWRYLMSSMHTKPVTIEVVVARAGMMRPAISRACSLSTCVRRHTSISTRQRDTQTHRQADRARDRTQGQNAGRERRLEEHHAAERKHARTEHVTREVLCHTGGGRRRVPRLCCSFVLASWRRKR